MSEGPVKANKVRAGGNPPAPTFTHLPLHNDILQMPLKEYSRILTRVDTLTQPSRVLENAAWWALGLASSSLTTAIVGTVSDPAMSNTASAILWTTTIVSTVFVIFVVIHAKFLRGKENTDRGHLVREMKAHIDGVVGGNVAPGSTIVQE